VRAHSVIDVVWIDDDYIRSISPPGKVEQLSMFSPNLLSAITTRVCKDGLKHIKMIVYEVAQPKLLRHNTLALWARAACAVHDVLFQESRAVGDHACLMQPFLDALLHATTYLNLTHYEHIVSTE
jgi:hypothetical protein